jgi:hypothetical protein
MAAATLGRLSDVAIPDFVFVETRNVRYLEVRHGTAIAHIIEPALEQHR